MAPNYKLRRKKCQDPFLNADDRIDSADLALWQQHYNPLGVGSFSSSLPSSESVPEPATLLLVATGVLTLTGLLRRRAM